MINLNINKYSENSIERVEKILKENTRVSAEACASIKKSNGLIPDAVEKHRAQDRKK